MNAEQRHNPRFSMQRNESIDAELLVSNASESRIPGRVVDISRRGAKFEFDGTLPSDDSALLRLKCEKVNWEVEIPGTIHWKHPNRSDGWWVGCSFQKAVQPVALERLAMQGLSIVAVKTAVQSTQMSRSSWNCVKINKEHVSSTFRTVDSSCGYRVRSMRASGSS